MAHFAEIDQNNVVLRVLVVPDAQDHRGETFLRHDLRLGGQWVQTSFNGKHRRRFAGVGMTFDAARDAFVLPSPFPSWVLDNVGDWQPPLQPPEGEGWEWDEADKEWSRNPVR